MRQSKRHFYAAVLCWLFIPLSAQAVQSARFVIPPTGQSQCFDSTKVISCPKAGEAFDGQDAQQNAQRLSYQDNLNQTMTDNITGLTWAKNLTEPISWEQAKVAAAQSRLGGHSDWRLPSIKELFTLMQFDGYFAPTKEQSKPFINTDYFEFFYAPSLERFFDVQLWSSTQYVSTTMNRDATIFGLNLADGRIKGYPLYEPRSNSTVPATMRARLVRGAHYGLNALRDNNDATVTDLNSGLQWQAIDDGKTRDWQAALKYCKTLNLAGHSDWFLPNAKQLHSIVDYTKSPSTTKTAAIEPPLRTSEVESYFWTSTTLADGPDLVKFSRAVYFAFGRALGWMEMPPRSGQRRLIDVHGAGAQRTDPKAGDARDFPFGLGPQGDDVRIYHYVRCVRSQ